MPRFPKAMAQSDPVSGSGGNESAGPGAPSRGTAGTNEPLGDLARMPEKLPPSLEEARLRRRLIISMLADGHDDIRIREEMTLRFGMSPTAVRSLQKRVLNEWSAADVERRPHEKRLQVRRILRHIQAAKDAKQHSAVASFEELLAQINGTLEPVEVHVQAEATVRESVMVVLAQMKPDRVQRLADQQRLLRAKLDKKPLPILDVEAEPVASDG